MNRKLTINSEDFFLSFNDNEYNCLKQYYAEYIKLKESTLIKENKIVNNLKISATVGEKINIVNPNEDYFAIFLHKLRPFILQNEPYSFHKISSLVNKKIESKIFRNEVNLVRKNFNNPESQIPIKLEIDNIQYNTNEFLYLYLNSFE